MDHLSYGTAYQRALAAQAYAEGPGAGLVHVAQHQQAFMNTGMGPVGGPSDTNKIHMLVIDLMDPDAREAALLELSKRREQYDELALVLWHSFGV